MADNIIPIDSSMLKGDKNNLLLRALFYEMNFQEDRSSVLYTLKKEPYMGYPSFYQLYMAEDDLTEYKVAKKYFLSLSHWERLCACTWFKDYVEEWRAELELKHRSRALAAIINESKSGSKNAFAANKYLIAKEWCPKKERRGRVSNEQIKAEANELFKIEKSITSDFNRILGAN